MSKTEIKVWAGLAAGTALLSGAGEAAILARGAAMLATSLCAQYCNALAAHLQDAAAPPGSPSVWNLGWAARGAAIEQQLGGNLPAAFPTIDRFAGGVATSIKSLDLNAETYQNGGRLLSTVEGYIDKVAAFDGGQQAGTRIQASQITGRELRLAVPGSGNAAQQEVLNQASLYATRNHVKLTIMEVH